MLHEDTLAILKFQNLAKHWQWLCFLLFSPHGGFPPKHETNGKTKLMPMPMPMCQCQCGCRRRPGRKCRRSCQHCLCLVGPGCCWVGDDVGLCHVCLPPDGNPQELFQESAGDVTEANAGVHRKEAVTSSLCFSLQARYASQAV